MKRSTVLRRGAYALRWTLIPVVILIVSLFASWRVLAAVDFAYPWFHDLLGIEATIERHGPRNELRPGFERTDAAERARLFGTIVDAVRADGEGLETIVYRTPAGEALGRLLTPAEIQHLHDVAALITGFERLGWLSVVLLPLLSAGAGLRREQPPRAAVLLAGGTLIALLIAAAVFVLGPVEVFYWLHERIFPPDHQWFFWYEESLMSMMMQAPNLFGAIAVLWFVPALALAALALRLLIGWLRRRATRH